LLVIPSAPVSPWLAEPSWSPLARPGQIRVGAKQLVICAAAAGLIFLLWVTSDDGDLLPFSADIGCHPDALYFILQ
jgi:hypothetical protein